MPLLERKRSRSASAEAVGVTFGMRFREYLCRLWITLNKLGSKPVYI
jgi:hypothetical protein